VCFGGEASVQNQQGVTVLQNEGCIDGIGESFEHMELSHDVLLFRELFTIILLQGGFVNRNALAGRKNRRALDKFTENSHFITEILAKIDYNVVIFQKIWCLHK
jgi:hypothetical protein